MAWLRAKSYACSRLLMMGQDESSCGIGGRLSSVLFVTLYALLWRIPVRYPKMLQFLLCTPPSEPKGPAYLKTNSCKFSPSLPLHIQRAVSLPAICRVLVQLSCYSSRNSHRPPSTMASRLLSSIFFLSIPRAFARSSSSSCVVGMSVRQNPGGVLRRSNACRCFPC